MQPLTSTTQLYNSADLDALIRRIQTVEAHTPANWGKMSASQMMRHIRLPLTASDLQPQPPVPLLMRIFFKPFAKKMLLAEKPYGQNGPTAPSLIVKDQPDIEQERESLIATLHRIAGRGPAALDGHAHPMLGKLTAQEWSWLQVRHMDHHLRQFGV